MGLKDAVHWGHNNSPGGDIDGGGIDCSIVKRSHRSVVRISGGSWRGCWGRCNMLVVVFCSHPRNRLGVAAV